MTPATPQPSRWYLLRITMVATLGGFLFGFDSGVISGAVGALKEAFGASDIGSGWNVSSMLLGCGAGALVAGRLSERLGRLTVMKWSAVFFVVSAWGSGVSDGSLEFVVYRVLGGLAVGAASVICPAYVCEIAPAEIRGRLGSLQQMAIVLGLFVSFLSNYLLASWAGSAAGTAWGGFEAWRWMFWIEIGPAVFFWLGLFFIPESPRYLVRTGDLATARTVLDRSIGADQTEATIAEIETSFARHRGAGDHSLRDPATSRIPKIIWIGMGLAALQQLSGINIVFYYGPVMWQAAGFDETGALAKTLFSGSLNIISTLIAISLIDRVGRKPMLFWGGIGMSAFLIIVALVFGLAPRGADGEIALTTAGGWAALVAANGYVVCFAITWGPVTWVLLGELFPNWVRGAALSVCGMMIWIANFMITASFESLLTYLGLGLTYGIYATFAVVSIGFVWRLIPETKNLRLEEMDELDLAKG